MFMFRPFRFSLLCLPLAAGLAHGALIHQFDLNGGFADNFGGPSLVANGGVLGAGSYTFDFAQGLSLSNPGISSVYTIDMMITLDAACAAKYCKLIDFKDFLNDAGFYTAPNNALNLFPVAIGSTPVGTSAARITLQRNAAGLNTAFLNGVQQFTYDDSVTQYSTFSAVSNIIRFLEDEGQQGNPGEHPKGSVDWIRIYNTAETPGTYVVGEGLTSTIPEPSTLALALAGFAWIAGRRRTTGSH